MVTAVVFRVVTLPFKCSPPGDCDQIKSMMDTNIVLMWARHCSKGFRYICIHNKPERDMPILQKRKLRLREVN